MRRVLGWSFLALCVACAQATYQKPSQPYVQPGGFSRVTVEGGEIEPPPLPLSAAEEQAAASIALGEIGRRNLRREGPIYLVHAEMLHDKSAPSSRRAIVQHYSYAGDRTLTSIVDLGEQRALEVREAEHVPAPLSVEEFRIAREAALADPRVAELTRNREREVVVEPSMLHSAEPGDPLFGHRVVRLMFRVGRNYLRRGVFVDLSRGTPVVFDDGRFCDEE